MIESYQSQVQKIIKIGDLILLKYDSSKMPITNFANISLGGTPSRKHPEYWNGSIRWINSGAITGTPAVMCSTEYITEFGVKYSATKPAIKGDSVLSIIEPSKNKVAIILDNYTYFNQSVICVSANDKNNIGLIYFASRKLIDEIKGYATGAAQQSLNKEMIESSHIFFPNDNDIVKLNTLVLRLIKNEEKIRFLKKIKNNLLSKYF